MRKIWETPGGVHPAGNKAQSTQQAIGIIPLADRYIVPIQQQSSAIVVEGQHVLKGQPLTDIKGFMGVVAHAPSSGIITAINQQPIPHPSGLNGPCISIKADGEDQCVQFSPADPNQLTTEQILDRIRNAGIMGMGGAGFPTAIKTTPNENKPINTLIINAAECEPYITSDDMLMREHPVQIVQGIQILAKLLGNPEQILIGIESNKDQAIAALKNKLQNSQYHTNIEIAEFPPKYPSGGEKQLIQILTGQELPSGQLPSDIGVLCQNVGTIYAIYKAVELGEPLISRITTVTGEACSTQANFEVPIGTPISHLLSHCGYRQENNERVIMGGPMMGFALHNLNIPIVKTTNCILAPSQKELPANDFAQACIRCGICAEACPISLLPQQLLWHAQAKNYERLESHNLIDCIECGACSFICPSKIPLVQYYRAAKGEIRQAAKDKIHSDRARERFEYNKQRKEKLEQEKLAKREARRLASEKAKAELLNSSQSSLKNNAQNKMSKNSTNEKNSTTSDVVQAALAQVNAKKASPEQQRAKLERAVKSWTGRFQRTQQKLLDAKNESPEKQAELQALTNTAQLKLKEAQQKLTEANSSALDQDLARVTAKITASPRETLETKIVKLKAKISNIEDKLQHCDDDNLKSVLQVSLTKFIGKRTDAENDIKALSEDGDKPVSDPETLSATERAIAKAKLRLKNTEGTVKTDPAERLRSRLAKAQLRLAEAEQSSNESNSTKFDNSDHIEALRNSIKKLQQKLVELEQ